MHSRFTQQCNVVFCIYADLCSLLAATSQFSILIGQNMQLTGCHNGNETRNVTCVDTQISIEWLYCSSLYCDVILAILRIQAYKNILLLLNKIQLFQAKPSSYSAPSGQPLFTL